jgi:hypothetical protein
VSWRQIRDVAKQVYSRFTAPGDKANAVLKVYVAVGDRPRRLASPSICTLEPYDMLPFMVEAPKPEFSDETTFLAVRVSQ